ncbi:hypothetical protein LINPERHAP1_LOCUS31214 [Linum perenne]
MLTGKRCVSRRSWEALGSGVLGTLTKLFL